MNINKALTNNNLMKSLTGLSILEFNELAKLFAISFSWQKSLNKIE